MMFAPETENGYPHVSFDYTVVLPARNEAGTLKEAVEMLLASLHTHPERVEILVVENGSTDTTWAVAQDLTRAYPDVRALQSPPGKGEAILRGWEQAESPIVLFLDADLSPAPDILPRLYEAVQKNNGVAIADRFLSSSSIIRSLRRRLLSRLWSFLAFTALPLPYADYQCGAKGCLRSHVPAILEHTQARDWFFDLELLLWARLHGVPITRLPVTWTENTFTSRVSHVPIVHTSLRFIRGLAELRRRLARRESPALPSGEMRHDRAD